MNTPERNLTQMIYKLERYYIDAPDSVEKASIPLGYICILAQILRDQEKRLQSLENNQLLGQRLGPGPKLTIRGQI